MLYYSLQQFMKKHTILISLLLGEICHLALLLKSHLKLEPNAWSLI